LKRADLRRPAEPHHAVNHEQLIACASREESIREPVRSSRALPRAARRRGGSPLGFVQAPAHSAPITTIPLPRCTPVSAPNTPAGAGPPIPPS
jgi:hypothetical protein